MASTPSFIRLSVYLFIRISVYCGRQRLECLFSECKVTNYFIPTKQKRRNFSKKSFYVNFPRNSLRFQTLSVTLHLKTLLTYLLVMENKRRIKVKEFNEEETLSYIKRHAREAQHFHPHALTMSVSKVKSILIKGCMNGRLKERFESVCAEYLEAFCKKHDLYMDCDWVGNEVGGIVTIGDYFINFDDIRLDIDKNAPEPCFFKWYYVALDYANENGTTEGCVNYKTYLSYFMGFSYGKESKK